MQYQVEHCIAKRSLWINVFPDDCVKEIAENNSSNNYNKYGKLLHSLNWFAFDIIRGLTDIKT